MDYETLNKQLRDLKLEKHEKEKLKIVQKETMESSIRERDSIVDKTKKAIEEDKRRAREEHQRKSTSKIDKHLNELNSKSADIKRKYDLAVSKITFDKYKERYSEDVKLNEQVKEILGEVKDTLNDLVGERFKSTLMSQLETATVEMNYDSIEAAATRINKLHKNLKILNQGRGLDIPKGIDAFLRKMTPCRDERSEEAIRRDIILYLVICSIITFMVFKFLSPILLVILIVIAVINISKGVMAYHIVLETKNLQDNQNMIDNLITKHVNEDMDKAKDILDKKHEAVQDKIQKRINICTDKLQEIVRNCDKTFKYDSSPIQERYNRTKVNIERNIEDIKSGIGKIDIEIANLTSQIQRLEEAILKSVEGMKSYYINDNVGQEYILEPKYLMDIVQGKPTFWEFPFKSCLFLYDSEEDVTNFINLVIIQTLCRLHVSAFSFELIDPINIGSDYVAYTKMHQRNFRLSVSKNEIDDCNKDLAEQMMLRRAKILESFNDIEEFNKEMLETDSLPASYIFNIIRSCEPKYLADNKVTNIVFNGPKVGVYTLAFMPMCDFKDMGDDGLVLLKKFHKVCNLNGGRIENKSKKVYERYFPN